MIANFCSISVAARGERRCASSAKPHCIHLPSEFARQLFEIAPNGMTVVIGSDAADPERVAHPGYLAPVKWLKSWMPIRRAASRLCVTELHDQHIYACYLRPAG
jgi:hypothetical protein